MQITVNQRIKILREHLQLTQGEFQKEKIALLVTNLYEQLPSHLEYLKNI